METVLYGCHDNFVLDGNLRSICQQDGKWSAKPSCNGRFAFCDRIYPEIINWLLHQLEPSLVWFSNWNWILINPQSSSFVPSVSSLFDSLWFTAPCNITIERGRILYKGKKLWIEDLKPNRMLHNEMVSVYCMNEDRNCSYVVRTQCRDGRLDMPECFEGKGRCILNLFDGNTFQRPAEEKQSKMTVCLLGKTNSYLLFQHIQAVFTCCSFQNLLMGPNGKC